MKSKFKKLRYACYTSNLSMSIVANLSPLLFITFRSLYGISYSLLGLLVLINFSTQLLIDLIFSFYSHKFNISKTVKIMPILSAIGLFIYAVFPFVFPDKVFLGLVIGTVIFAMSSGLAEVLISPVIASIPAENPDREMSKLHSIYAWGVVAVVIISTLFILIFGKENWQWLALIWMTIPIFSSCLFIKTDIPVMITHEKASNVLKLLFNKSFILFFLCIFFGGAAECTMAQWSSSYLEQALSIPKVWGDVFGVALFAVMLGLGRSLYSKFGKHIHKVLFLGSCVATICYVVASITSISIVGLLSCAITGFCVSMLWPGSLIIASDKFASSGIAVFALMAAGGDLGGSIGPQTVGVITDTIISCKNLLPFAQSFGLTLEQFGMKVGILSGAIFPLLGAIVLFILWKVKKTDKKIGISS